MDSRWGPTDWDEEKKILGLRDLLYADYDKFSYPRTSSDAIFPNGFIEKIRLGLMEARQEQFSLIQNLEHSFIKGEEVAAGNYNEDNHVKKWILRRAVTAVFFERVAIFIDLMIQANLSALRSGQIDLDAGSKLYINAKEGFNYGAMIQEFFVNPFDSLSGWESYNLSSKDQTGYSDFQKQVLNEAHVLLKSLFRASANKRLEKIAALR
jgi:hypothetical protein